MSNTISHEEANANFTTRLFMAALAVMIFMFWFTLAGARGAVGDIPYSQQGTNGINVTHAWNGTGFLQINSAGTTSTVRSDVVTNNATNVTLGLSSNSTVAGGTILTNGGNYGINITNGSVPVSVMAYGAKGDGVTDDTAAIQACVSNNYSTYIPTTTNKYIISSQVSVPSNRKIILDSGAVIFRASNTCGTNAVEFFCNSSYANGTYTTQGNSNITILGGYYDGNNLNQTRSDGTWIGGTGFRFVNVSNLEIGKMTVSNPVSFYEQFVNCTNFYTHDIITFLTTNNPATTGNNDVVFVGAGCANGTIQMVSGNGSDDYIAYHAQNEGFYQGSITGNIVGIYTADINMTSNSYSTPHGIVLWSASGCSLKNIYIQRVTGTPSSYAVKFDAYTNGTADIEGVTLDAVNIPSQPILFNNNVTNCRVLNTDRQNAIVATNFYSGALTVNSGFSVDDLLISGGYFTDQAINTGTLFSINGNVKNLTFKNIFYSSTTGVTQFLEMASSTNSSVTFENVKTFGGNNTIYWSGGTCTNLTVANCSFNNISTGFYFRDSCSIGNAIFANNSWNGFVTGVAEISGTVTNLIASGNYFNAGGGNQAFYLRSITTRFSTSANVLIGGAAWINRDGTATLSVNGLDQATTRSWMTPASNDLIMDSTSGISRWNGSAWTNP